MSDLLKTLIESKTQERSAVALMGSFLKAVEASTSKETFEQIRDFTLEWLKEKANPESDKLLADLLKKRMK